VAKFALLWSASGHEEREGVEMTQQILYDEALEVKEEQPHSCQSKTGRRRRNSSGAPFVW